MGWFPGYAINVETGERLNIAFGEDSWQNTENGDDMLWNPTSTVYEGIFRDVRFGGKHYICVFRNDRTEDNRFPSPDLRMPAYDAGEFIAKNLADPTVPYVDDRVRAVYKAAMWVGMPLLEANEELLSNDATVHLRVTRPFDTYGTDEEPLTIDQPLTVGETYLVENGPIITDGEQYEQGQYFVATSTEFNSPTAGASLISVINNGLPMYRFSLDDLAPETNREDVATDFMEEIRVVPNPYYAYSEYETDKLDNRIKIINLPQTCTVTIYTLNGSLIRTIEKDDPSVTSVDWDLKNHANIPVSGGMYLIHIDAPGIGEKVLKWFGVMRPVDLDSF